MNKGKKKEEKTFLFHVLLFPGSVIVFTAGLSIVLLKRWPRPYQYLGIIVIIGKGSRKIFFLVAGPLRGGRIGVCPK